MYILLPSFIIIIIKQQENFQVANSFSYFVPQLKHFFLTQIVAIYACSLWIFYTQTWNENLSSW
jgi:hypothetical protein